MKILAINLLRLGDVIMTTAPIGLLKKKYPNSKIHFLINKSSRGVEPLLTNIDKVIYFDRNLIQHGLGEPHRPLLEPYYRLMDLIDRINNEKYDLVINFTQNFLSAYLMDLISSPRKEGMLFSEDRIFLSNEWFKKLNEDRSLSRIHYIDLLNRAAAGEELCQSKIHLRLSAEGERKATEVLGDLRNFITVQPLTSDEKKNWGLANFLRLCHTLQELKMDRQFVWLGAPDEEKYLREAQVEINQLQLPIRIIICDLETSLSILNRSNLVITGDTATKHMAVALDKRIVEISLGSSDFYFTGAYGEGHLILSSLEPCAPCNHRLPCARDKQYCAISLHPQLLAKLIDSYDRNHPISISNFGSINIHRTFIGKSAFWSVQKLNPRTEELHHDARQ